MHARAKRKERRRRERREESVCLCDIFIPELKACTASGVGPMQLPTLDNQVYDVWFSKHGVVEFVLCVDVSCSCTFSAATRSTYRFASRFLVLLSSKHFLCVLQFLGFGPFWYISDLRKTTKHVSHLFVFSARLYSAWGRHG